MFQKKYSFVLEKETLEDLKMSVKDAKTLGLLPRLTSNEKKVYQALTSYGAANVIEISQRGGLSKGRVSASLEKLIERGLVVTIDSDSEDHRYVAVFPVMKFIEVISTLISSLDARKSELEGTTELIHNFTETAIKNVREASTGEREKRTERSEEDIKDMEIVIDASFSGILASIESDLKELNKIAKTSNEFVQESSIRTEETSGNITNSLKPISQNFRTNLGKVQSNAQTQLESTIDARVSDILDFETKANNAFDEVLEAFKDSQEAFEDIIFTVLDSGIADLEKVTRPINDQIEQAINSLKSAIQDASNNFQTEMVRVLTEQKRPMISAVDSLRPKINKALKESIILQNETLDRQHQSLSGLMENHLTIFSKGAEELALEFDNKVDVLVEQSIDNLSTANEEMNLIETKFVKEIEKLTQEKDSLVHDTSNKTRDILNEMMEQFIVILNRSVAQYQMDLGDLIAQLETDFLNNVENSGTGIQNLVSFINMSLTEPVKTLLENLDVLNQRIEKEEGDFLTKFDQSLNEDLSKIIKDYQGESKKKEDNFQKELERIQERLNKDIIINHEQLKNRTSTKDRDLQNIFKELSTKLQKELRDTNKEVSNLTRKLERWRGESVKIVQQQVDTSVDQSIDDLSKKVDTLVDRIRNTEVSSSEGLIRIVHQTFNDISKEFKDFGTTISKKTNNSLNEIADTLKKDSLTINNRLVQFKKEQDKLIDETRFPATKLLQEFESDYKILYQKVSTNFDRFFTNEADSFRNSRQEITRVLQNTLDRKGTRTSKEILSLKDAFERSRENYVNKTKESFERIEKAIAKDSASLIDQEKSTRESIISLTEKTISSLSNGVNSTAESVRTNLWEGAERIFGQAAAEINKQEMQLKELNEKQQDESIDMYNEVNELHKDQLEILDKKMDTLKEKQIGNAYEFRDKFTDSLRSDLNKQLEILRNTKEELNNLYQNLTNQIKDTVDSLTNRTIQDLETQTSSIEGAIFGTVGIITAEAARKTEGVVVIGEQAVLGIEERYTENLETIRQSLTDEVFTRIESEAKNIEKYKGGLRQIGREHLTLYGKAVSDMNISIKNDIREAEKAALKTIEACESISCRFLTDLNDEITTLSNRLGLNADRVIADLLGGFDRVLQKVKRDVGHFARKQFELSNKSNYEIAEAFLKSVDDLEEVMLKQIESFGKRTNISIERTKDISEEINVHIKDMTASFKELTEN